jgi:hypothetical protein
MWDVLPLVAFYSNHSKNSEILLVHLLGCNDHNTFMRLTWVIHVSYGICRGFHFKKIFMMFYVTLSFFKTQMILLRSIITDLSLRPNEISSLSKAFPPHHLSATSLHFLNILHTKWASNESCLPKNAMNLRTLR